MVEAHFLNGGVVSHRQGCLRYELKGRDARQGYCTLACALSGHMVVELKGCLRYGLNVLGERVGISYAHVCSLSGDETDSNERVRKGELGALGASMRRALAALAISMAPRIKPMLVS